MTTASTAAVDYQRERRLAWFGWSVNLLLTLLGLLLLYLNQAVIRDLIFPGFFAGVAGALGYSTVGLLILFHQPRHAMGWLFMGLGSVAAITTFAEMYAIYGLLTLAPRVLAGAKFTGWLSIWSIYPFFPTGIALPYLLYPDGLLPSRRWRPVAGLAVLSVLVGTAAQMLSPDPVALYISDEPIYLPMVNPTGLASRPRWFDYLGYTWLLALVTLAAALVAPIFRFRHAQGLERQQLKWFVYFGGLTSLLFPLSFVAYKFVGGLFIIASILVLPTATAIAIVRHQLYDIDFIIRRTLVYGVLTTILALIYFSSAALLQTLFSAVTGQESPVTIVLSTLLIAALFSSFRRKVQDFIDRRFYRRKYDAVKTLAAFAVTARDEVDLDDLTAELLRVVDETMRPERVSIWLRE